MLGLFFFSTSLSVRRANRPGQASREARYDAYFANFCGRVLMKPKPLHVRISDELSIASDPERRAELLARLAGHLARIGQFEDATRVLGELRKAYSDGRSGRVTVWILLAEGLVHLFLEEQLLALDKFKRVLLLGQAMKYRAVVAVAAAWKAHLELGRTDLAAMTVSLRLSFDSVEATDHDTHTRLAMVLFNSFTTCGDRVQAQKWFLRAHDRAVINGDQASIEALLYNRATFGVAYLRAENCFANVASSDVSYVRSEMESLRNLHQLVLGVSLSNQRNLWFARLLILEKRYLEAVESLASVRTTTPFADNNFSQRFIDLEITFCEFLLEQDSPKKVSPGASVADAFDNLDVDELLVAEWMQWKIASMHSTFGDVKVHFQRLEKIKQAYTQMKAATAAAVAEFVELEPKFARL
jgi:hypothetical protein